MNQSFSNKALPLKRPNWNFSQDRDSNLLWLDKNECNYSKTRNLVKNIFHSININSLSTYPDLTTAYNLFEKNFQVKQENAYFTYGSDAAIRIFFEFCSNNSRNLSTLLLRPSFGMYEVYAKYYSNNVIYIDYQSLHENFQSDHEQIFFEIDKLKKGDIFIVANPESPLGISYKEEEILKIISKCNEKGVFILLDETYIGFSHTQSQRNLINVYANLFVAGL